MGRCFRTIKLTKLAGWKRARQQERIGGRPKLDSKNRERTLAMIDEGKSQSEVAQIFRVHRATICRLVQGNLRVLAK
jgi:DNA invertase Pin-like site-specific DNA recombinase